MRYNARFRSTAALTGAVCLSIGGCIRWNEASRTVSGAEFLALPERYTHYDGPNPLGTNRPHWAYGGEDSRYYYAEHWGFRGESGASWVEYESSIRAPKSEMPEWRPPERGAWLVPTR